MRAECFAPPRHGQPFFDPLSKRSLPDRRKELISLAQCEVCGNDYDKAMEVTVGGASHVFDSFECAIHALAPVCGHCGCKVVGHGIEAEGSFFCCAHCAAESGVSGARDRL